MSSATDINKKLRDTIVQQVSCGYQITAVMKLYEAAAMVPNNVLMEQYREQLHTLIDVQLDTCNEIMELTRQLIRAS